ncbi:MAG: glycosyltransferase family 39 protein [Elusimicrobia bacterium]|nr:glycosyltransferase family 39 protein [Elusimicrobiota bacterium]
MSRRGGAGSPAAWTALAALALTAAALWAVDARFRFVGFDADPIWYLEPARNFGRGLGLVTRLMLPAQVAFFPEGFKPPVLFLHHGPLGPLLIGLAYKALGLADWVPLFVAFSMTLGTGVLLFLLGSAVGGRREALTAVALFWSAFMIIEGNYHALTDPPFIFFITAAALILWKGRAAWAKPYWYGVAGLALGLACCTRLAGQSYWPGFIWGAWWLSRDWRRVAFFLAGLALPMIGLSFYNHAAAGIWFYSPGFYVLNWSPSFPGFRSSTTYMGLTSFQAFLAYPLDFIQKALTGPLYAINRFVETSGDPYLMAVVVLSLLTRFTQPPSAEIFKSLVWILALPVFAFNAVISYGAVHYLDPLAPLFCLVASLFVWKFIDENVPWVKSRPALGLALFAFLFLSREALEIKDHWKSRPRREALYRDQQALGEFVRRHVGEDEIIYTDANRTVVWQGDRTAIALTATMEDAEKTFKHLPPDALLLTSLRIHSDDYDQAWRDAFYKEQPVMGFAPIERFSSPNVRALLLRRPEAKRRPRG